MRCERGVRRGRKRATRSALILVYVERGPLIDGLRLISPEIANSVDVGVWADRVLWRPDKVGQTVNEKKSTGQYVTLSNAFVGPFPKSTFSPRDRDPPALLFWFVTRHLIRISRRSRREAESEKNLCSGEKILPSRISNPLFEPVSRPKNERQIRNTNPVFVTHRFILFAHTESRVGKSHQIRISKPGMRHILFLSFYAKRREGPLANAPPRSRI